MLLSFAMIVLPVSLAEELQDEPVIHSERPEEKALNDSPIFLQGLKQWK